MKTIQLKALSLAILSLAFTHQAQAGWTGTPCSGNGNNGTTCTITDSQSGSGAIGWSGSTSDSGTLTVNGSYTSTGNSSVNVSGLTSNITINISNSGSLTGTWGGIYVAGTSGQNGTVNINNSGSIIATQAQFNTQNPDPDGGKGIQINGSGVTAHIVSTGTIQSKLYGILMSSAASGSTIDIQSGTVSGGRRALQINTTVDSITVGTGAKLTAPSEPGWNSNFQAYTNGAIYLNSGQVNKIDNKGTIEGAIGIMIFNSGAKVENITNSGVLKSTSASQNWTAAVTMITFNGHAANIGTFINEKDGRIEANAGHGLSFEFGTNIQKFINRGSIDVGNDGFNTFYGGGGSGTTTIGSITLESGSSITAGNIAISLTLPSGNFVHLGSLDVQEGAEVTSKTGPAIELGSTTDVSGSQTNGANGEPTYINLSGILTSPQSAFVNSGTIGTTPYSGTAIQVGEKAQFKGSDKTNIVNNGTINGNIVFSNSQNASFANLGTFNGKIIVQGTGGVTIKDWAMSVVPGDNGQGAKVETIHIDNSASNAGPVVIDHVSINEISSSLMGQNIDFSNAFVDHNGHEIALNDAPTSVSVGSLPSSLGFDGTYDAQTKKFYTSFNVAQTAGAVVSQTLANQLMRRDFFLESAVTEAATGSLYHRLIDGVEGTAFVKPYFSSDTFDFDGANMEGHTQGVMMGINRFVGRHILTGYVGYERSQMDSDFRSSTMNLDIQSWYGGFNTAHLLQSNALVDTFLKGSLKASYTTTGLDRQILLNANTTGKDNVVGSNASVIQSSAKPNTVAVGMNVQLGMNFKPLKETQVIPMVGLGYSIGKTSSYQLDRTGLINDAYMPERVMMPYADASVTWFQGWGKIVRTFVGGGMRYILDRTQKTALSYGKLPIEGEYSLPQSFQYVNASMVLHITHHSEIAVGYTGVFDSTGHSQNLTTKYELHF